MNEPPEMLENVRCNLCGAAETTVLFNAGVAQIHRIVKCESCGLMFANPRAKIFFEPETDPQVMDVEVEKRNWEQRIEKEKLQVRDYNDSRAEINRLHPERGTLLDIGCGFGYLLDAFREDGWKTIGIDPWSVACDYAAKQLGIDARTGTIESVDIPDSSVDVVVMNHVIEHVDDPVGLLKSLHRVLKPGGHFVMETPTYDTMMFRLLRHRERSLSCNGHIYFFTPDTLSAAAKAAGFDVMNVRYVGRSLTLNRLAYNIGVVSKRPAVRSFLEFATRRLGLNRVRIFINARDMQRAFLIKGAA